MANEYELRCPKCGNDTKFSIVTLHTITIDGDDIDHDDSLAWENNDAITCQACAHDGTVKSFDAGE